MTPHPLLHALALACALATLPATAATLQLTVLDAEGRPAEHVAVQVQPTGVWAAPPPPSEPVVIAQQSIRFLPFVTIAPVGATVRFINRDRFDHHVRSQPSGALGNVAPAQQFEFRLAAAKGGKPSQEDLRLDAAGVTVLGCHLHGSMRGHLIAATTPWIGVSDGQGRLQIADVPDGPVTLRLWHPDQLVEQPVQRLQASGSVAAEFRLNLTPRRRPPPRPSAQDDYKF
ncbi:MAG: plastocyanin [Burkholderiaceae bacterium]|nr:plastocyanin [Burkholderiaceae bacterium]